MVFVLCCGCVQLFLVPWRCSRQRGTVIFVVGEEHCCLQCSVHGVFTVAVLWLFQMYVCYCSHVEGRCCTAAGCGMLFMSQPHSLGLLKTAR
jgi:hypothetical protein